MTEPFAQPRSNGSTHAVALQRESIIMLDINTHPLYKEIAGNSASTGAIVSFPLTVGERFVGVMNAAFAQPRQFSEEELRNLRLLANQAAMAIQNARLYHATARRRRYPETLRRVCLRAAPLRDRRRHNFQLAFRSL